MSSPLKRSVYQSTSIVESERKYQSVVENERKDVIITHLKCEASELRQCERDYTDLTARINNLQHRYNLIQDEKLLDAREWNTRHEQNQRTMALLKDEVNALRTELAGIDADVQDLKTENSNINAIIAVRNSDIAKLKADLADLVADNNEATAQRNDLERHIAKLQNENKDLEVENLQINDKIAEAELRENKNTRLVKELEGEVERAMRIGEDLKDQGSHLRAQIRDKANLTKIAEQNLSENRKRIISLESRLNDAKRINDRLRADIVASQNEHDKELLKGAALLEKQHKIEDCIAERDLEIADLVSQVEVLKRVQKQLLEDNDYLINDIKAANRNLDVATIHHYELIEEINRINIEDDECRHILHRKDRINDVIAKVTDRPRHAKFGSCMGSPARTASTRDEAMSAKI